MSVRRVDRAVADYTALRTTLLPATDEVVELVTGIIDDAGINYLSVTGRTKTVESFAGKARVVLAADSAADPLREVTDQVGVRVITYVQRDVDAVADLLTEQFTVLDDRDLGEETAAAGRFGYASRHLLVSRAAGSHRVRPALLRLDPAAHRAPARLGRVRARHPLQGHGAAGAGPRPRPAVHPRGRVARAGGPGVRGHPRPPPGRAGHEQRRHRRTHSTRGSAPRSSRRSSPAGTPAPDGRAPSTTRGSPVCCSSSASPRSTS